MKDELDTQTNTNTYISSAYIQAYIHTCKPWAQKCTNKLHQKSFSMANNVSCINFSWNQRKETVNLNCKNYAGSSMF